MFYIKMKDFTMTVIKKKKKSPYDCKKWAAIPLHPRVAALRCLGPLQPQHPKKMRKKRSQLLHSPAH
jgi:hypothetical protein